MLALKMKQGFVLALAAALLAAVSAAGRADSAGRTPCLVSNERSHHHYLSLQDAIDAAAAGDTLVVMGTCVGNFVINKNLTLQGVSNPGFGVPMLDGSGEGAVLGLFAPFGPTVAINDLTVTHGTHRHRSGFVGQCDRTDSLGRQRQRRTRPHLGGAPSRYESHRLDSQR
jgi:nitrous oxidase accessory protein NosD